MCEREPDAPPRNGSPLSDSPLDRAFLAALFLIWMWLLPTFYAGSLEFDRDLGIETDPTRAHEVAADVRSIGRYPALSWTLAIALGVGVVGIAWRGRFWVLLLYVGGLGGLTALPVVLWLDTIFRPDM